MKGFELNSAPDPRPQVSLLEKDSYRRVGDFPGHEEKVTGLGIPIDPTRVKKNVYDDILIQARQEILDDENLLKSIFEAITAKNRDGAVIKFAEVENILVEKCINLTDNDIDNTIRQLGKKFLDYVKLENRMLQINGPARQELMTGRFNIDSRGIKSVVNFVRERTRLLMSGPKQNFVIGFNNRLDAGKKIDLIEIIFGETDSIIEQLNLIQVKSSPPTEDERNNILERHNSYANYSILSLKEIEKLELASRVSINSVASIIAVGPKIIKRVEVYNSGQSGKGALAATM